MDLLKALRLNKHYLYSSPVKCTWKRDLSERKSDVEIKIHDWPKVTVFPWRRPKYYERR